MRLHLRTYGTRNSIFVAFAVLITLLLPRPALGDDLVESRDVRTWEYLDAIGQKSAILGDEGGEVEVWVYPLKLFKNFHLVFHSSQRSIPAKALARTVITRPESSTIIYASDNFTVRETFFVPIHQAGGLIVLDASPEFVSDWGMRMISEQNPQFAPDGYHFGAVWPLFTGWASVGEYAYHRSLSAYELLRANCLLVHAGARGRLTEVLSGTYFEPLSTSSPHQTWSSAMVVSPILRGLFGMQLQGNGTIRVTPHLPATWTSASFGNVHVGGAVISVAYKRSGKVLRYTVRNSGTSAAAVTLSPAFALGAHVTRVRLDSRPVTVQPNVNALDQHVTLTARIRPGAERRISMRVENDFGLEYISTLPARGSRSRGLRFVSERWSASQVSLVLAGVGGQQYQLRISAEAQISSIENATETTDQGDRLLLVSFANGPAEKYELKTVIFHFSQARRK